MASTGLCRVMCGKNYTIVYDIIFRPHSEGLFTISQSRIMFVSDNMCSDGLGRLRMRRTYYSNHSYYVFKCILGKANSNSNITIYYLLADYLCSINIIFSYSFCSITIHD